MGAKSVPLALHGVEKPGLYRVNAQSYLSRRAAGNAWKPCARTNFARGAVRGQKTENIF